MKIKMVCQLGCCRNLLASMVKIIDCDNCVHIKIEMNGMSFENFVIIIYNDIDESRDTRLLKENFKLQ